MSTDLKSVLFDLFSNKLKSLKVAQVKDEIDGDDDDGIDVVL